MKKDSERRESRRFTLGLMVFPARLHRVNLVFALDGRELREQLTAMSVHKFSGVALREVVWDCSRTVRESAVHQLNYREREVR